MKRLNQGVLFTSNHSPNMSYKPVNIELKHLFVRKVGKSSGQSKKLALSCNKRKPLTSDRDGRLKVSVLSVPPIIRG